MSELPITGETFDTSLKANVEDAISAPREGRRRFLMFQVMPSWLTSFLIHMGVLLLLAILTWELPGQAVVSLVSGEAAEDLGELTPLNFDPLENQDVLTSSTELSVSTQQPNLIELSRPFDEVANELSFSEMGSNEWIREIETGPGADNGLYADQLELFASDGALQLSDRTAAGRRRAVEQGDATAASENAVELALEWIALQQRADGSWEFEADQRSGKGRVADGRDNRFAATSMALLSFLGAGETHRNGKYQEVVEKGLAYLLGRRGGTMTRNGLSFMESTGSMYSHGLTAICLCEAYAMTDDSRLFQPTQDALRFIEYAQDPIGGGWRYMIKQRGDTSVVGWQIMALKSANLRKMQVSRDAILGAERFLRFVSTESGAYYGYTHPEPAEPNRSMTSVGLLCRMYLGWKRGNPSLERGVQFLAQGGPSTAGWTTKRTNRSSLNAQRSFGPDMYFNYYATQVMHHFGGEEWKTWNETMREFLVDTQTTQGESKGSWSLNAFHSDGRLYTTTLATMTLEVYYRYLPLYDDTLVNESKFILD